MISPTFRPPFSEMLPACICKITDDNDKFLREMRRVSGVFKLRSYTKGWVYPGKKDHARIHYVLTRDTVSGLPKSRPPVKRNPQESLLQTRSNVISSVISL